MCAPPPSPHSTRLDHLAHLSQRTKPHRLRSHRYPSPVSPAIPQQAGGRHYRVQPIDRRRAPPRLLLPADPLPRDAPVHIHRAPLCTSCAHPGCAPCMSTLLLCSRAHARASPLGCVGCLCDTVVRGRSRVDALDNDDGRPALCHDGGWRSDPGHSARL